MSIVTSNHKMWDGNVKLHWLKIDYSNYKMFYVSTW